MEEKQQKKIKASLRPGKLAGYLTNFLASEEADGRKAAKEDQGLTEAGEVGRVPDQFPCLGGAGGYVNQQVPGKLPCLGRG